MTRERSQQDDPSIEKERENESHTCEPYGDCKEGQVSEEKDERPHVEAVLAEKH